MIFMPAATHFPSEPNRRILVIDDNRAIHEDFRKILAPDLSAAPDLDADEQDLFGNPPPATSQNRYEIDSAYQGGEGLAQVRLALAEGRPYAMAFVDVRMPPGMDGVKTALGMWEIDSDIQVVLCTAYSDYTSEELFAKIGNCDRLVILKKPFDRVEAIQLANAFTEKWWLLQLARQKLEELEQRVAERTRELQQSESLLRIAGRTARLGGWAVDLESGRIAWSDETCVIHGVPAGTELTMEQAVGFYTPPSREVIGNAFTACAELGTPFDVEVEFVTAQGQRLWVRSTGEARPNAAGVITRVQGAFQDITERKTMERQFLHAQRMESIGTLAGGIAHDLNNVLAPIMMSIDLLKLGEPDAARGNILSIIADSAQRGAAMVEQVVTFARGVDGVKLHVAVAQLLIETRRIVDETFPKSIHIEADFPADLWAVLGDPTQLQQVLLNLCINARDAMPDGGTLTLTAENLSLDEQYAGLNPEAQPGPHVLIRVEDSGTGMSTELVEKIFEPFFTTKPAGLGSGLGLATARVIVKSHAGFIQCHSEPGNGARFHLYLPALAATFAPGAVAAAEIPRGNGELVLLVEDEDAVLQITRRTLETFGYRVVVANDGVAAVELYARRDEEIAVVVTDMMMPVMDGPATIRVLRKLNPALPVIAVSGICPAAQRYDPSQLGVNGCLTKPYSAEALLTALARVLGDADSGQPAARYA